MEVDSDGVRPEQAEQSLADFAWEGRSLQRDALGVLRIVENVRLVATNSSQMDSLTAETVFHLDPDSWRPVARTVIVERSRMDAARAGSLSQGELSWRASRTILADPELSRAAPPCGLPNPLQGHVASAGLDFSIGPCALGDFKLGRVSLRPVAWEKLGGADALVFSSLPDAAGPAVHAWLRTDIPFLARLVVERPDHADHYDVIRLATFERGPGARDNALDPPDEAPTAPLAWAPREAWGPKDADAAHAFPLSAAFRHARDDPLRTDLREFLERHPAARTVWAQYAEARARVADEAVEKRRWEFAVVDGEAGLFVDVAQAIGPPAPSPTGLPLPAGPAALPTYEYGDGSFETPPASHPAWRSVGSYESFPTVASLAALWRSYAPHALADEPEVGWGFGALCDTASCLPGLHFWSGVFRETWQAGSGSTDSERSFLVVDARGQPMEYRVEEEAADRDSSPAGLLAKPVPGDDRVAPASVKVDAWALPPAHVLAGAGVLAAMAGLVYWAWAPLKSFCARALASVGLYSRMSGDELLDYPVRGQIVELVDAAPGCHFQEIARRLGLSQGVAQHHLRLLVDGGLLVKAAGPHYVCYFVRGRVDRRVVAAVPLLKSAQAVRLLEWIASSPGPFASDAARHLGLSPDAVRYHARRLIGAGVLREETQGRRARFYPTEVTAPVLAIVRRGTPSTEGSQDAAAGAPLRLAPTAEGIGEA